MGVDETVWWGNGANEHEIEMATYEASLNSGVNAVIDLVASDETIERGFNFLEKVY